MSARPFLRTSEASLAVRCLAASEAPRWDAFVMANKAASFFHLSGWARVTEEALGHRAIFLYAERGGEIEGVLPLALVDSWLTGRALVSTPACIEGGVLADSEAAAQALEDEALLIARQLDCARLELRGRSARHQDWPSANHYVRFEKPILPKVEDNLAAIPRKQRAVVRKGIALGLADEIDDALDNFHALYCDNSQRHGSPALPRRYFDLLRAVFGPACEILTVRDGEGRALSSVLSFYFKDTVLPYYAGDLPAAREFHANDFKYWALMKRACERGFKTFDYGRSRVGSGSWSFKKNWGCTEQPLVYQYRVLRGAAPEHHPGNPKYRALIGLWKRLPPGLARAMGPHLVRHFL